MAKNKDKSAVKQDVTLIKGARTGGVRGSDSDPYFGVSNVKAFTKAFDKSRGKTSGDDDDKKGKEEPVFDALGGVGGETKGRDVKGWQISDGRTTVKNEDSDDGYYLPKDEYKALVDRYMADGWSRSTARRKAKDARKGAPIAYKSPMRQANPTLVEGARTKGIKGSDSDPYFGVSNANAFADAFEKAKNRQRRVSREVETYNEADNKGLNQFKNGNMECANFSVSSRDRLFKAHNYTQAKPWNTGPGPSGALAQREDRVYMPSESEDFNPKQEIQDVNDKMTNLVKNVKNLQADKKEWVEMSGGGPLGKSFYSAGSKLHYKAALDDIMTKEANVKVLDDGEVVFDIEVDNSALFGDNIEKTGATSIRASIDDIKEHVYPQDNIGQLEFLKWKKEALNNTREGLDFDEQTTKAIISSAIGPDSNINHGNLMSWAMDDANQDGTTFMEHYLEAFPAQTFVFDGTVDMDDLIEVTNEKGEIEDKTVGQMLKQEIIEYNVERLRRNHNALAKSKGLNNISNPKYSLESVDGKVEAKTITGYES